MTDLKFTVLHHLDGDPLDRPSSQVYAEVMEHVILADRVGFDTVWFAEHHAGVGGRLPQVFPFIAAAAERTRQVKLGLGVVLLPFYNPIHIGEQIAVTDILTGGRVAVGIGSGSSQIDYKMFGVVPATKGERMVEGTEILLKAWSGETFNWQGKHYQLESAQLHPTPVSPARDLLWLGVGHPLSARTAGELDLHLMLARGTPTHVCKEFIAAYHDGLAARGLTPADRFVQRTWIVYVDETEAGARAAGEASARFYYNNYLAAGRPPVPNDDQLEALLAHTDTIVGTPDSVAETLAAKAGELGLTHVALHTRLAKVEHGKLLRSTELLGQQVLPAVRARLAARDASDTGVAKELVTP